MKINAVLGFSYHIFMSLLKIIKWSFKCAVGNHTYSWRMNYLSTVRFVCITHEKIVPTKFRRTGILRRRVLSCHLSGKPTKLVFFHQESKNRPRNIRIFGYDCNLGLTGTLVK